MALKKPEMVLLDLDGTLVDTAPDLAYSIDAALAEVSIPPRGETRIRHWIGNGLERTVKRALQNAMQGEPEEELFQRAYPIFIGIYTRNASRRSRLYDGAREGIDYLKNNDYKIGCVTNKSETFTHILLKDLGIFDDFGIVISGDSLTRKKPDPQPLLHAADHFSVNPEHSLMIGDSLNDVEAARAAGFQILCVSYGYNHGEDIRKANPDTVVDSLAELPAILSP
jgi:2-phosphoglycolate phosphatase, prokaryotic